jgi:hypothetical protein
MYEKKEEKEWSIFENDDEAIFRWRINQDKIRHINETEK